MEKNIFHLNFDFGLVHVICFGPREERVFFFFEGMSVCYCPPPPFLKHLFIYLSALSLVAALGIFSCGLRLHACELLVEACGI